MRAAREWDSEALSYQSDNEVDLSHFAPMIDTAVSFSGVQAISFSLLWIDTAPLHCVLCVFSPCPRGVGTGYTCTRGRDVLACPAPAPQGAGQRTGLWLVLHT